MSFTSIDPALYYKDTPVTVTGTVGVDVAKSVDFTFTVRVKNPCVDPIYNWINVPANRQFTYIVN